ncbi:MAG: hypothetical protein ACREPM_09280 [Gemmatimonadaceae bacterium]
MSRSNGERRRGTDAMARFLAYLDLIEAAVLAHEPLAITALLRKRTATHLPREVREELLLLSRASRDSLRAPVRFLRFQHRMHQLAQGGEGLPTAQIELSLESRADAGEARRADAERRPAASDPRDARDARDPLDARDPRDA